MRRAGAGEDDWLIGLHYWSDSSILVWPCRRKPFSYNSSEFYFELCADHVREPTLVAFHDLAEWQAATFEYRFPAWQMKHVAESARRMSSAVRRVQVLSPTTVLEVAAK